MSGILPELAVSRKGEERLRSGHLWVFGDDLRDVPTGLAPGEWVRVATRAGELLGTGTLNMRSRIALRLVSRGEASPSREFVLERIRQARDRRAAAGMDVAGALRLVYSEGDFLPGLIVDRYGPVLSVQILTAGMERVREEIAEALEGLFSPRLVYERSEGSGRRREGLPERKGVLSGGGPSRETVAIDGLRFEVDVAAGPKTGFFLDQRENRKLVRAWSRDRTVLDAFCSTGGFGIYALAGGALSVLAVDASESAVGAARGNAALNGFSDRWEGRSADLFADLRAMAAAGARLDLVVLDPPSFAQSREGRESALRGYRDINRLALAVLAQRGMLATS